MSALKEFVNSSFTTESAIVQEIMNHKAWYGRISGLQADKMLRGKKTPYLFILREGENEMDFYVSFVLPDLSVKHQPFVITVTENGWHYENCAAGGPFTTAKIDDVLHLIMHCEKFACFPKINPEQ